MTKLIDMKFIPSRGDEPQVTEEEAAQLLLQLPDWGILKVDNINHLQRVFQFKNFIEALSFTNLVADLAERQDHHPALLTEWGKVTVTWWTHVIKGLHQNDFISAAKTDQLYSSRND